MKNMPVPDIMIRNEHAYVSLVYVIDHFLGYGLKLFNNIASCFVNIVPIDVIDDVVY